MAFFAVCNLPSVDGPFEAFVKLHELTLRAQPDVTYPWRVDATLNVYLKEGLKEPIHRVGVALGVTDLDLMSGSVAALLVQQIVSNPQPELRLTETKAARVQRLAAEAVAAAGTSMQAI